ncbi:NAD(P)-dependent alcohol dehydrogenase [Halocatena halophila]|uniref:NAD(P)-dependent alcohol dehydrogenase n=1 Tax=Halocatena halophila TaxID=2814576 RepID=UPI0038B2D2BF
MKSYVMYSVGDTGYIQKDRPDIGPNDALIRPTKALVCTSDIHTVHGAIGEREDITLGHEAVGIVEKIGDEIEEFDPGDRVAIGAITPEWGSLAAQNGHPSQSSKLLGGWKFANSKDGVFAEYVHVNDADANMAHIPPGVSDEAAVYTVDMMSTGFSGAERADIPIGGTVVVFGQGAVGLMATRGAALRGASNIIAVDRRTNRRELAEFYGANETIDYTEGDTVESIMELTDGEGVDAAIEAAGSNTAFENCIKATKPGGTISVIGYFGDGEHINIPRAEWGVGMGEKDIVTSLCPGGRLRLQRLLRLLDRDKVDPTRMTTHTFKFEDLEEGIQLMESRKEDMIKPLIDFE